MMKRKSHKKRWIASGVVLTIIVVLTFSLNLILESIFSQYVASHLETNYSNSRKEFTVGKINFNILERTFTLKDISIVPDSSMFEQLKDGELEQLSIMKVKIPVLKLEKLGILKILIGRNLSLNKILIRGIEFTIYKNEININREMEDDTELNISLDSISIAGLNSINLSDVEFELFSYTEINITTNDTIFSFRGNDFDMKGLELVKTNSSGDIFKFDTEKLSLNFQQQRINLRNKNYFITLGELNFSFSDSLITVHDLMVKPTRDKYKMGASYKYTKEVFDVEVKLINFFGYKVNKLLKQGIIDIDSILIDGMNINIYKDGHKPFDLDKRPLFVQQQLKALKQPLHIKNIRVSNSRFNFAVRPEGSKKLMNVDISNIEAEIDFITSIKDSLQSDKKLLINLNGIFMGASPVSINMIMPYNSPVDTFYFSGELGSSDFAKFNPALYPATGIKFTGGRLNSLKFYAHANLKSSEGLMTMLYDDLEAEIPKKNSNKKSKFLSFTANTVLRASNPSKREETRVALVKTDRVEYKGFGNLLWKSVQSGLINTILPIGKSYKEEKLYKKQEKKNSPEKTKKKRRNRDK